MTQALGVLAALGLVVASGCGSSDTTPEPEAEDVASSGGETDEDDDAPDGSERASQGSAQADAASLALPEGPEGTVVCAMADGAIRWLLPLPEGFISLSIEGRCHLTTEDERSTVMVEAIAVGDAGPEQQLAIEPDGVRRWIAAGFAPNARPVSEGTITVAGETTHWYRLRDTVGEQPVPIELLAMRRTIGSHHVLVVVFLKEGARWTWPAAERWVRGITVAD